MYVVERFEVALMLIIKFKKQMHVLICSGNKAGDMATEAACGGGAGAVIKQANLSIWAGAAMKRSPKAPKELRATDQPTDRPTWRIIESRSR